MSIRQRLINAISKSLIEYGYPDAKPAMIAEIYDAYKAGKREFDLPHGIVGQFAGEQLREFTSDGTPLP